MPRIVVLLTCGALGLAIPYVAHAQVAGTKIDSSRSSITAAKYPAQSAVSIPDSVRRKVGYQHWKGAAIGGVLGAVGGLVLGLIADGECYDCTSNDPSVLKVGLVGAGLGGAFGFLVGSASPRYEWIPSAPLPMDTTSN
jgi:hypothetical protein